MAVTNFDQITTEGAVIVGGDITPVSTQAMVQKIVETVAFGDMTDVTTTLSIDLSTNIPIGATVLRCVATALTGFAGDTSATIQVGDGTDADRYSTGTPDVFTTIAAGLDLGLPSGTDYHVAAKTPKVTITTAADATSVTAGSITLEIYYIT